MPGVNRCYSQWDHNLSISLTVETHGVVIFPANELASVALWCKHTSVIHVLHNYNQCVIVLHVTGIDAAKISENVCLGVEQQRACIQKAGHFSSCSLQ